MQNIHFYSFCQSAGLLHDPVPTTHKKKADSGDLPLRALMTSLQGRQDCVGLSHSGSDVAPVVVVVVVGVETGSVASHGASSNARSMGRGEPAVE